MKARAPCDARAFYFPLAGDSLNKATLDDPRRKKHDRAVLLEEVVKRDLFSFVRLLQDIFSLFECKLPHRAS